MRPLYRGEYVWGKTISAYGRELGQRKTRKGKQREAGQVPRPEETWIRRDVPKLRIIDADLAARVDARREDRYRRALAAKEKGRAPQNAGGKYLLSGGMLICPTCGGHFEVFKAPWRPEGIYVCSTRRRKPGVCTNTLTLSRPEADEAVLNVVEGEVLETRFIEELLAFVDRGEADDFAHLTVTCERLQQEMQNLVNSIAAGVPAETLAPAIRERQREITNLQATLNRPRPAPPNIEKLREALEQRATEWRETLRTEPQMARVLLRRLIGPLTLTDPADHAAFDEWAATLAPGLLEGLAPIQVGNVPSGIRTRVLALKGPRPGPLDDGDSREECDDSGQDRNM